MFISAEQAETSNAQSRTAIFITEFNGEKVFNNYIKNDRFLTIIQTLVIWINAKKLGVACGDDVPESIQTYINIRKMHCDIDFEHLLKE